MNTYAVTDRRTQKIYYESDELTKCIEYVESNRENILRSSENNNLDIVIVHNESHNGNSK